jgi:putative DNA primase/helicase
MEAKALNPVFDDLNKPETIAAHVEELVKGSGTTPHTEILQQLLEQVHPLDFEALAFPHVEKIKKQLEQLDPDSEQAALLTKQLEKIKLNLKHYLVLTI